MRRHTLPLVERRERLADMKSLTLTVHLKPIGHALSIGHGRTSAAPTGRFFFSFPQFPFFSSKIKHPVVILKYDFRQINMSHQTYKPVILKEYYIYRIDNKNTIKYYKILALLRTTEFKNSKRIL